MELFFSRDFDGNICRLDQDESAHCVKVLRHREGDMIHVIDGEGTLYNCRLLDASPKAAEAEVVSVEQDWGAHPYFLQMGVCPTKNLDRFEWFAEKATELGVDVITPTIGDHSERKVYKTDRLKRILLSASKQSLKGAVPQVDEPLPLSDFIRSFADRSLLKLIACCYEGDEKRVSISDVLSAFNGSAPANSATLGLEGGPRSGGAERSEAFVGAETVKSAPRIVILIGPEGDFSREEVELAIKCGFKPVHLGPSRLRTETAALTAVAAVYFHFSSITDCYTDKD
ncbi:MAG: RsmE family RNA methyltransferase [Bacteroidia bacterium]|nr:RsmE family RNA methyltransferase [Bacteroidia bacterium]